MRSARSNAPCGISSIWPNASKRSMSMLSQSQRATILELHSQGVSKREIARVLNISRLSVRKVLRSKSSALPALVRPEKAEAYRVQILELLASHKGGADGLLPASWYRPGTEDRFRSYHFQPGEELQHDTSPHETEIGGKKRKIQTASAVLCYSRMMFFQCYPTFQRFDCKVFLTEALRYFGGATQRVMIDFVPGNKIDLLCPIRLCGRLVFQTESTRPFKE